MKLSTFLLAAAAIAASAAAAPSTYAAVVTGSEDGSFSNVTGCNTLLNLGCGVSPNGNTLRLGTNIFGQDSSLSAIDQVLSFNVPPTQNDFVIGEINWLNVSTTITDPSFRADYNFALSFTSPGNSSDTQTINIRIQQPTNPPGNSVTNLSLTAPNAGFGPFTLAGIEVSDIKFVADLAGGSTYDGTTGVWFNPKSNRARMFITADFTAVPEPASMALLGAGLVGFGTVRHRI